MLLLFSGGCDSTSLLYDMMSSIEYKSSIPNSEKGVYKIEYSGTYGLYPYLESVRAISINHEQVPAAEESRKARSAIIASLLKKFPSKTLYHTEVTIATSSIHTSKSQVSIGGGLIQPTLWMLQAAQYLDESEDLYVGYIKGDCIWHYKHELITAFNCLQQISHRTGKLIFPLEWTTKIEVIKHLKQNHFYNKTWYCERPVNGKRCGRNDRLKCNSCKTHDFSIDQFNAESALEKKISNRTRRLKNKESATV